MFRIQAIPNTRCGSRWVSISETLAIRDDVLRGLRPYLHKGNVAIAVASGSPALSGSTLELGKISVPFTLCRIDGDGARLASV